MRIKRLRAGATAIALSGTLLFSPGLVSADDPGGGVEMLTEVEAVMIANLRRELHLTARDLAIIGLDGQSARPVLEAIRTWCEANRAACEQADAAFAVARLQLVRARQGEGIVTQATQACAAAEAQQQVLRDQLETAVRALLHTSQQTELDRLQLMPRLAVHLRPETGVDTADLQALAEMAKRQPMMRDHLVARFGEHRLRNANKMAEIAEHASEIVEAELELLPVEVTPGGPEPVIE